MKAGACSNVCRVFRNLIVLCLFLVLFYGFELDARADLYHAVNKKHALLQLYSGSFAIMTGC